MSDTKDSYRIKITDTQEKRSITNDVTAVRQKITEYFGDKRGGGDH